MEVKNEDTTDTRYEHEEGKHFLSLEKKLQVIYISKCLDVVKYIEKGGKIKYFFEVTFYL